MCKNRRYAILAVVLLLASILSLFSGCVFSSLSRPPILKDRADAIEMTLDALFTAKSEEFALLAAGYEASGEILTDANGDTVDMPAYIADLKARAETLPTLTYRAYSLAIMDYMYENNYIGEYKSVLSLLPDMVDILATYAILDRLSDETLTTDALMLCYTMVLGDPYASYVDSKEATAQEENPTSFVGIGVSVYQREDGLIEVLSTMAGSPAEEGGVLPGDILIAVEGVDITTTDYYTVLAMITGEIDTDVVLTFMRDGSLYTQTFTRRLVELVTVEYKLLSEGTGKTGYIRISEFSNGTFDEFVAAYEALEALGATALVFDVRSNPGGNAEIVIAILEYILPDDITHPIVRFTTREGEIYYHTVEEYLASDGIEVSESFAKAKNHSIDMRMAVLCNEHTASAGELFTSCLMDFGVAEVYGVTTYGKGLGQYTYRVTDYYAYEDIGQMYYTHFEMAYLVIPAFFYSPPISDNYHEIGVTPHHVLPLSEEAAQYYISAIPEALDNQLAAARTFVESDDPMSPPPVAEENTSQKDKGDGISTPALLFLIFFGGVVAGVIGLAVYLVIDYRRSAHQSARPLPQSNEENDN